MAILNQFGVKVDLDKLQGLSSREIEAKLEDLLIERYEEKERMVGPEMMRQAERMIMLNVIDNQWKDHLLSMDHLREGSGLRGYGQKDPLVEYKKESFILFQDMMDRIEDETIRWLFFMQRVENPELEVPHPEVWSDEEEDEGGPPEPVTVAAHPAISEAQRQAAQNSILDLTRNIQRKKEKEMAALQFLGGEASPAKAPVIAKQKAGRNDPCPCGSGKKYKKCCGAQ